MLGRDLLSRLPSQSGAPMQPLRRAPVVAGTAYGFPVDPVRCAGGMKRLCERRRVRSFLVPGVIRHLIPDGCTRRGISAGTKHPAAEIHGPNVGPEVVGIVRKGCESCRPV